MDHAPIWQTSFGDYPLVAAAIHDGHDIRAELQPLLALSDEDRLREEDPHTGLWTSVAPTRIVGLRSRFEVDLNRPREKAVYQTPDDCWGLTVWKEPLAPEMVAQSLQAYDHFYAHLRFWLDQLVQRFGRVVVFDLHSYNHRRDGVGGAVADAQANPEVNVGTGTMDRQRWAPVVDRFIHEMRSFNFLGRQLDVRENVRFRGGNFPRWIHEQFPDSVCAIAIEFKKFFMDEWTGHPEPDQLYGITEALRSAAEGVLEVLHPASARA